MVTLLQDKRETAYEWLDIVSPTKAELSEVAKKYKLSTSLVEDSLQPEHLPKYEIQGDIQFIILRLFSSKSPKDADTIQQLTDKIAVFIGPDFIITIHRREYDFLKEILDNFVIPGKCTTPHQLLFRIVSKGLSGYESPLSELMKEIDFFEPKIFLQEKTSNLLKSLYYIKRKGSVIDYILDLTKGIIDSLKGKISSPHFHHLKDELLHLQSSTKQINDNVSNLLNIYISLSSQRTNEVVRVLTLFSVFFMPLTFIVGVYGMNFDIMPELRWKYGYLSVMLLMLLIIIGIFAWFRRKGWL